MPEYKIARAKQLIGGEPDSVGFIKYSGDIVAGGIIDAKAAGEALSGLDKALRFFNEKQSGAFASLEYDVPIQTRAGSWEALLLAPLVAFAWSYSKKAAEKMAEKDFQDVGFTDVFKTSLSAIQHLIRLVKHTGQTGGWDLANLKWRNENKEAGVLNDKGEVLYIPAEFLKWYTSAPIEAIRKITGAVKSGRLLTIGVKHGNTIDAVSVNTEEKELFDAEESLIDELEAEVLFPELQHGAQVKLEGRLVRGNVSANSMGFEYKGHILNCTPHTGSVKRFKPALFLRCAVDGTITRLAKHQTILDRRPTIIVDRVTSLEYEAQHKLF